MATAIVAIPSAALTQPVNPPQVPSVFLHSTEQEYLYELYHSDSLYYRVQREFLFLKECVEARSLFFKKTLSGATLGAVVGGLTGFVASKLLRGDEDEEKNKERALKFTGWGMGIGGTLGALFKGNQTISAQAPEYNHWKGEAILSKFYPLFQQFLKESPELQEFLCDLRQDLITHPLRAPNGKIYEKEAIEEWLSNQAALYPPERLATMSPDKRRQAELCFCPGRSCFLKIEMLTYDYEYHQRVAVALKAALNRKIQEEYAEGLHQYNITIRKNRSTLMQAYLLDFTTRFANGEMSDKVFQDAVTRCRDHYALPR